MARTKKLPRLVSIEQDGSHVGLLSTTDDRLVEILIAVFKLHTAYTVRIIGKEPREPERDDFLKQFEPKPKQ